MKTVAIEKPRSSGTVTVKLDPSDRDRIASLATMKKRTPHYLMKEAILEYVQREEARQNFTTRLTRIYAGWSAPKTVS